MRFTITNSQNFNKNPIHAIFATLSKLMNYYVLYIYLTTYDIKKSGGLIFEKISFQ